MTTPRDPDAILANWLEEGPERLPESTRRAIAVATRSTRQVRPDLSAPWRGTTMYRIAAIAAVAVIAIAGKFIAIGGGLGSGPGVVPSPPTIPSTAPATESPSSSAQPAAMPALIDRSAEGGYTVRVPTTWTTSASTKGLYFSIPMPGISGTFWEGRRSETDPSVFVVVWGDSGYSIEGSTIDQLLESTNAVYRRTMSAEPLGQRKIAIGDEPAWVVEHPQDPSYLWLDAVVIHGDRAYDISLMGASDRADSLRVTFDELLASIVWTE